MRNNDLVYALILVWTMLPGSSM